MNHSFVPIELDAEHNVGYIALDYEARQEKRPVARSERVHDIVLDFDASGRLVGIELLDLVAVFPLPTLPAF